MTGCRPLSEAEITALLNGFERLRDKALFVLGVKSGFRISELLSLRVRDVVQFGKPVTRVTVQRKHMKKKLQSRTVPLHLEAGALLMELIQREGLSDDSYLFQSQKGPNKPISRHQAWRVLKKAFEAHEIQGSTGTHSLRKTFANRVYEKLEHDLLRTQKALGHKSINSTVAYLSFKEEEVEEAILAI